MGIVSGVSITVANIVEATYEIGNIIGCFVILIGIFFVIMYLYELSLTPTQKVIRHLPNINDQDIRPQKYFNFSGEQQIFKISDGNILAYFVTEYSHCLFFKERKKFLFVINSNGMLLYGAASSAKLNAFDQALEQIKSKDLVSTV
ncbi:hypothetical protein [Calothrix sp. NIES-2098]|uniref:hypothetical protein n=1 Tax=Calothrix sp. NIES-2098 TaxID=1954171 RepID=UPI0030DD3EFF